MKNALQHVYIIIIISAKAEPENLDDVSVVLLSQPGKEISDAMEKNF